MSEVRAPVSSVAASTLIGLESVLLDRVEAAVMATDLQGVVLFANPYVETLFGWSAAELIGHDSSEMSQASVSPATSSEIMEALRERQSWEGAFAIHRKDGSVIDVRSVVSPLYDRDGELVGVVTVTVDAGREREFQSLLAEQVRLSSIFRRMGEALFSTRDRDELMQLVTDIATEAVGASMGAFFYNVLDEEGESYVLFTLSGVPRDRFDGFPMPRNTAVFGPTFNGEGIVRSDDITADPRYGHNPPYQGMPEGHLPVRSYLAAPVRSRSGDVLGGLFFAHSEVGAFRPDDEEVIAAIASQAGVALATAELDQSLRDELALRARTEAVERFLVECGMVLASSLDYQEGFEALATLCVPFLGDVCLIDVAEDDALRRVAAVHADPDRQELMDEFRDHYSPDPAGPHPAVRAIHLGEPSVAEDMSDEFLRVTSRSERHYALMKELGFRSYLSVPLNARGRTLGSLTLVSCTPERRFGASDLAVAQEVARYTAVSLDNVRLFEDQQRARQDAEVAAARLADLQRLSTALSRSVSVDDVVAVIREMSLPRLGDASRGIWLRDDEAEVLRLVKGMNIEHLPSQYDRIPYDSPLPAAEVLRTEVPVLLSSLAERDERYPMLRGAETKGVSFAIVPMLAEARALGVLAFGFAEPRTFATEDEVTFLTAIGVQCGQAIARAVLYDRERRGRDQAEADRRRILELNAALQTSLLPPSLPDIPGVEVAARYHPAMSGLEVGGDFYDVFDTGGDWAAVVGDVCGKGPVAAAVTATARWTLRSVAMDVRQPAQVLRKLNEAMVHQSLDDRFCTVAYTRIVPTAHGVRITVCRGGHPSPVVVRADGPSEAIGTPGSLIGVLPDVRLWEETTNLVAGDALVLFTDGVTEARRGREEFGEERVLEVLGSCAGTSAEEICDALEQAVLDFSGQEPTDDTAILVLRVKD